MRVQALFLFWVLTLVASAFAWREIGRTEMKGWQDKWYAAHDTHPLKSQETLSEVPPAGIGKPAPRVGYWVAPCWNPKGEKVDCPPNTTGTMIIPDSGIGKPQAQQPSSNDDVPTSTGPKPTWLSRTDKRNNTGIGFWHCPDHWDAEFHAGFGKYVVCAPESKGVGDIAPEAIPIGAHPLKLGKRSRKEAPNVSWEPGDGPAAKTYTYAYHDCEDSKPHGDYPGTIDWTTCFDRSTQKVRYQQRILTAPIKSKLGKRKPAPPDSICGFKGYPNCAEGSAPQQGGCTPEMGPGCVFIDNGTTHWPGEITPIDASKFQAGDCVTVDKQGNWAPAPCAGVPTPQVAQ